MKNDVNDLAKVEVKTHAQLLTAIEPFTKDTTIRKLLMDGMEMVKRQAGFAPMEVSEDLYGGFKPAMPARGDSYMWVDTLIERRLDGKRSNLRIVWTLPEGRFEFDPWTKKLEQVSGGNS